MLSSFFLLFLSLFTTSIFALQDTPSPIAHMDRRQTTSTGTQNANTQAQCADYSRTANFSTIGANSTYRSAFLQLSPFGTDGNRKMLDAAVAKLPALTKNAALNAACGNLTTLAFVEAAKNFTNDQVAGLSGIKSKLNGNPQAVIGAGMGLLAIVGGIIVIFGTVWCFMLDP